MRELAVTLELDVPIPVGVLAEDQGRVYFQFDPGFLDGGLSLSPHALAPRRGLLEHQARAGVPLPGVFSDSRPDGWGLRLLHRLSRGARPSRVPATVLAASRTYLLAERGCTGPVSRRAASTVLAEVARLSS